MTKGIYEFRNGKWVLVADIGNSEGTTDYNDLDNKPSINDIELKGNKTQEDLKLDTIPSGDTLPSGKYDGQLFIYQGEAIEKGIYKYNGNLWSKLTIDEILKKYVEENVNNYINNVNQAETYEKFKAKTDKVRGSVWNIKQPFTFKDGKTYPANTKLVYKGDKAEAQSDDAYYELTYLINQYHYGDIKVESGGMQSVGRLGGKYYQARINSGILDSVIYPDYPAKTNPTNNVGIIADGSIIGGTTKQGAIFAQKGIDGKEGTTQAIYGADNIEIMSVNSSGKFENKKIFTWPDEAGQLAITGKTLAEFINLEKETGEITQEQLNLLEKNDLNYVIYNNDRYILTNKTVTFLNYKSFHSITNGGIKVSSLKISRSLLTYEITEKDLVTESSVFDKIYPVGSIYMSVNNELPSNFLGTWERIAQDKTLWGGDGTNAGTSKEAGLPNIKGEIVLEGLPGRLWTSTTFIANKGAFSKIANGTDYVNIPASDMREADKDQDTNYAIFSANKGQTKEDNITYETDESKIVYGKSTTVQPRADVISIWKRVQ